MTIPQPPAGPGSPYGDRHGSAHGDPPRPGLPWSQILSAGPAFGAPPTVPRQASPAGNAAPPRLASRTARLIARTADYTLTTAFVLPLWFLAYQYIQAEATDLPTKVVRNAFLDVVFGRAGETRRAPLEAVDGLWDTTVTLLLLLLLAHLLVPALYDWFMHARYGRTLGKIMVGAKVVPVGTTSDATLGRVPVGAWRAARRTFVAVVVPWGAVLLTWYEIALREWATAGVFALVSLIGFTDPLAVLGPRRRAWHDRTAGTVVVDVAAIARSRAMVRDASTALVRGARDRWRNSSTSTQGSTGTGGSGGSGGSGGFGGSGGSGGSGGI